MNFLNEMHCRRCETLSGGGRRPFAITGSQPRYAPDIPFKMKNVCLDVAVDPVQKRVAGKVRYNLRVISPAQSEIRLDQFGVVVSSASINGEKCEFRTEDRKLIAKVARPFAPGTEITLEIDFVTVHPRRGMYFTGPDRQDPKKPLQVWTQGQDEDHHFWFPTFDYPNQKASFEIIASVPAGFTAVANGALLSREKTSAGGERFHYKLAMPQVIYLLSLVVAEFSHWKDEGPRGLLIEYFVAPGREADGKRSFHNTPKMLEAFERVTGVPYAYEKYAQTAVQDFIFGGMENTSVTTQTDQTLHDERAHLDFSSDALVAHELAHQWFGDLVTCRDWSHGWLNEGFATFMQRVWMEADSSKRFGFAQGGPDEAAYSQYLQLKEYLEEDSSAYRRPIVCNQYIEPIDLFDRHLYQKGGLVLNLLRAQLGPELFWQSVRHYLERHKGGSVETLDLIRAIEDVTGRNLRKFFDQWVFGAGHPELEVSSQWHEDRKLLELTCEQKQTGGAEFIEKDGSKTHLFSLPVKVRIHFEDGTSQDEVLEIGSVRDRGFFACSKKPKFVNFDPGFTVPKTLKFTRPLEMLKAQLAGDSDCMGRITAVSELKKSSDRGAVEALAAALMGDAFWGVQAEAALALAEMRAEWARDALAAALEKGIAHPKARRAAVKALGSFKNPACSALLRKFAEKDASYFVEAEACVALAQTLQSTPGSSAARELFGFLKGKAEAPGWRGIVRSGAIRAMGELAGFSRGELPEVLEYVASAVQIGQQMDGRVAAISVLGQTARLATPAVRGRILEALSSVVDEDNFKIRMALVPSLGGSAMPEALGLLARIRSVDTDGRVKRHAFEASQILGEAGSIPEVVGALKEALEKLEEEHRKLRTELETLKGKSNGQGI